MRARVWNDGKAEYREKFRGEWIVIPAKSFIEMDAKDANTFRAQFVPIVKDGLGNHLNEKALRVEKLADTAVIENPRPAEFVCQMDGSVWPSQDALDNHILKNFKEQIMEPEAREKLQAKVTGRGK